MSVATTTTAATTTAAAAADPAAAAAPATVVVTEGTVVVAAGTVVVAGGTIAVADGAAAPPDLAATIARALAQVDAQAALTALLAPADTEPAAAHVGEFHFGHISLAPMTMTQARDWIVQRALSGTPGLVVTSNINHLMLADADPAFRAVVERCELNVADGWPLVAASRLLGPSLPQRIAGIDLVEAVISSPEPLRIAILGGPPGSAERLAARAARRHEVVLVDPLPADRPLGADGIRRLGAELATACPNLVLIGLGAPKQELLADALRGSVQGPIICCGAAIEVLAGMRPRAPGLVQRIGMEWAFRCALEPRRLGGRYVKAGSSFLHVLADERARSGGGRAPAEVNGVDRARIASADLPAVAPLAPAPRP